MDGQATAALRARSLALARAHVRRNDPVFLRRAHLLAM